MAGRRFTLLYVTRTNRPHTSSGFLLVGSLYRRSCGIFMDYLGCYFDMVTFFEGFLREFTGMLGQFIGVFLWVGSLYRGSCRIFMDYLGCWIDMVMFFEGLTGFFMDPLGRSIRWVFFWGFEGLNGWAVMVKKVPWRSLRSFEGIRPDFFMDPLGYGSTGIFVQFVGFFFEGLNGWALMAKKVPLTVLNQFFCLISFEVSLCTASGTFWDAFGILLSSYFWSR